MAKNNRSGTGEQTILSPVRTRGSFSKQAQQEKDCLQTDSSDNEVKQPSKKRRRGESVQYGKPSRPRTRSLTLEVEVGRVRRTRNEAAGILRRAEDISRSVPARGKGGVKKTQKTPENQEAVDKETTAVRRSVRESRKVFDSLNEQNLVHSLVGDYSHSNRPSKHLELLEEGETDSQGEPSNYVSMYDIIKNKAKNENEEDEDEDGDEEENNSSDEDEDDDDETSPQQRYKLRKNKPITKRYTAPPLKAYQGSRRGLFSGSGSPHMRVRGDKEPFSPIRKSYKLKRKTINESSTSTDDDDDDNRKFERRKAKSMAKARNRCLPMNLGLEDVTKGILADRERIGSSLADVDPMSVDRSITFDSIGGLRKHIRSLKEMVVFPLLYPEIFEKFKVNPPRGVLFYGPPGTGKTLMARALANECSQDGKKVAFFMRKGADCLSKWVGESERQLRLLFDQAFKMRPSIIFFDEIDGLAPVRSSRQDQIHSSIVSTLLALMDGLDNRGEIIVIGATNRIDSIDPALRRPGRFDREFIFPLPDKNARRNILSIHTKAWQPKLCQSFISEVGDRCVGYCGADIKALCTEATLFALRRRYPQIYASKKKLILDIDSVQVNGRDFAKAINTIVPACQRAVNSPGRALSTSMKPLLHEILTNALAAVNNIFPPSVGKTVGESSAGNSLGNPVVSDSESSDEDDAAAEIYESDPSSRAARAARRAELRGLTNETGNHWHCFAEDSMTSKGVYRPRYLVCGRPGMGQSTHITPAILHSMEHLPVHCLDLPALFGCASKTPEEACAQVFREARRVAPSIIYLSRIELLWSTTTDTLKATFLSLMNDLPPTIPLLLFATSDLPPSELPHDLTAMFSSECDQVFEVSYPTANERWAYFEPLVLNEALKMPCSSKKHKTEKPLEVLAVAAPPVPRELSASEVNKVREDEENTLRELRIFLREITVKLMSDRKFKEFYKPVDLEEVPDYVEVVKNAMDLSTMLQKVDGHQYQACAEYLTDIDLITSNALEYNPNEDTFDRLIRHRACALKDCAHSLIMSQLDPDFEKACVDITESRRARGESKNVCAPKFFPVAPVKTSSQPQDATGAPTTHDGNQQVDDNTQPKRMSRRVRGLDVDIAVEIISVSSLPRTAKAPQVSHQISDVKPKRPCNFGSRRRRKRYRKPSATSRQATPLKAIAEPEYSGPEFAEDCVKTEECKNNEVMVVGDSAVLSGNEMDEEKPGVVMLEEHVGTPEVVCEEKRENGVATDEEKSSNEETPLKEMNSSDDSAKNYINSLHINKQVETALKTKLHHLNEAIEGSENGLSEISNCDSRDIAELDSMLSTSPLPAVNGVHVVHDGSSAESQNEDVNTEKSASPEKMISSDLLERKIADNEIEHVGNSERSKKVLFLDHDEIMEVTHVDTSEERDDEISKASTEDRSEFESVLFKLVKATEHATIETLERCYCSIKHCIIQHKKDDVKRPLLHDLTVMVDKLSSSKHSN